MKSNDGSRFSIAAFYLCPKHRIPDAFIALTKTLIENPRDQLRIICKPGKTEVVLVFSRQILLTLYIRIVLNFLFYPQQDEQFVVVLYNQNSA